MAFSTSTNTPKADTSGHVHSTKRPSFSARSHSNGLTSLTPSRCTSCEARGTPCRLRTPRNSCKTPSRQNPPVCDRFIPVRKGVDHDLNSYKLLESLAGGDAKQQSPDDVKSDFQRHLEKQLLDKSNEKILAFKTKPPKSHDVRSGLKTLYSMNKDHLPKRLTRHIPQSAERVLDAPELLDDYYLNLLDWNRDDFISIALGPSVYLWNARTASLCHLLDLSANGNEGEYVSSLSYDKTGRLLAVGTSTKEVQLWDVTQQHRVRVMRGHASRVSCLSWNGPFLTSASQSGHVHHHDVRIADHCVALLPAHGGEVCGLKWSPDGRYLASGGNDNVIKIWEGIDGSATAPLHSLTDHTAAVKALAWCPWHSTLLASGAGTADRCIKFWNVVTGQCLNSVDTKSQVCGLLWSAEHRELVSGHGYSQNQLTIWKYPTMTKLCQLMGHTGRILHLCSSPDKTMVASLAADETLRLWSCFQADVMKKNSHTEKAAGNASSTRSIARSIR